MKLRQIKSKYKKQIADFQRGKDLDYDAELALLAYAYDKGLVSSDDADEVDDAHLIFGLVYGFVRYAWYLQRVTMPMISALRSPQKLLYT